MYLIIHLQYEFIFTHYCNKKGHHSVIRCYHIIYILHLTLSSLLPYNLFATQTEYIYLLYEFSAL